MEIFIQWWFWIALGLVLMAFELLVPTFFMLWIGAAALTVGLATLAFPLNPTVAILLWALFSALASFLWFKYFKSPNQTTEGLSKEAFVGKTGLISKEVHASVKGEIMFQSPVLGADRWPVVADETIKSGEYAKIIDVLGQVLKVERVNK